MEYDAVQSGVCLPSCVSEDNHFPGHHRAKPKFYVVKRTCLNKTLKLRLKYGCDCVCHSNTSSVGCSLTLYTILRCCRCFHILFAVKLEN